MAFGAFVEILPGKDGLVHISELAEGHVDRVEDVVDVGDRVKVKVIEIDNLGRVNLSMREAGQEGAVGLTDEQAREERPRRRDEGRNGGGGRDRDDRGGGRGPRSDDRGPRGGRDDGPRGGRDDRPRRDDGPRGGRDDRPRRDDGPRGGRRRSPAPGRWSSRWSRRSPAPGTMVLAVVVAATIVPAAAMAVAATAAGTAEAAAAAATPADVGGSHPARALGSGRLDR